MHAILLDNYQLISTLGEGYSSIVKLAKNQTEGQLLAIKILKKIQGNYQQLLNNFINEIQVLQKLQSKHLPQLMDYSFKGKLFFNQIVIEDDITYIVLELISRGEVFNLVKKKPLSVNSIKYLLLQLLEALIFLHSNNIVHGDLKLENIMLSGDYRVKIIDFGFSIEDPEEELSIFQGTRCYQCPELLLGKTYNGKKADVFTVGVMLFILYFGFQPFLKADIIGDLYYRTFVMSRYTFWRVMDPANKASPSMKKLIEGCLEFE